MNKNLSYEFLIQSFEYTHSQMENYVDSFNVRGWNPNDSFNVTFIKTETDIVIVKK